MAGMVTSSTTTLEVAEHAGQGRARLVQEL
jgi:hypothetical protein